MTHHTLIDALISEVQLITNQAEALQAVDKEAIYQQPAMGGWSIAAILHHLNLYSDFYLPVFQHAVMHGKYLAKDKKYKAGWLGNYFANSMLPKEGVVKNKMKTFADKNPDNVGVPQNALQVFLRQQGELLALLKEAKRVDLKKNSIPISITKWITLQLGDGFRFYINHEIRHMVQIASVKASILNGANQFEVFEK